MDTEIKTPVVVYAESTPNPATMKFVANKPIVPLGNTHEYKEPGSAKDSPLAQQLFKFSFVKSVFISGNYITLTKTDGIMWEDVLGHIREYLKQFLQEGSVAVKPNESGKVENGLTADTAHHASPSNSTEEKIINILEEYIRPAVENDGGLITFKSFNEGKVSVVLKGSCSGCPSASITLKAGIEALLKRMVPEVKEVVAEEL